MQEHQAKANELKAEPNSAVSDQSSHLHTPNVFRGLAIATVISLPFWALLIYLIRHL